MEYLKKGLILLEANQNMNKCLVSNFYSKLKFRALFSVRWQKSEGDFYFSLELLARQLF